jgi:hypothetical protein
VANWTLYEKKIYMNGTNTKDREINAMKSNIMDNFQNSPSCKETFINDSNISTYVQVNSGKYSYVKNILMMPDEELNAGDILSFDNKKWLCIEVDKINPVYQSGTVYECAFTITLNRNNILYEVPICIESGVRLYQLGVEENKFTNIPSTTIVGRISNNEINQLVERNDVYKIGLQNWKVVDINDAIEPGILVIKFEYHVGESAVKIIEDNTEEPTPTPSKPSALW